MRVGLVTPYSWTVPGGVNHHIENLAAELEARGHEPWIIAPVGVLSPTRRAVDSRRQRAAERFIPMGTAVPLPSNGSRSYISANPRVVLRMDRALRNGRFDVLHIHEPGVPWVGLAAVFLATSPVVATFHAALESSFGYEKAPWLGRAGMARLDVRIAVSEAAREFPARLYPGDYRIIPNGVAVEKYAPALGAAKVKGRVFFIGRAEKRKGLGGLLHAFARLRRRLPHATLVIAGATRGQALEASRLGYGPPLDLEGVEALGWVDDDEKVAQLAQAEVVCAPFPGRGELRHRTRRGHGRRRAGGGLGPARLSLRAAGRRGRPARASGRAGPPRRGAVRPAAGRGGAPAARGGGSRRRRRGSRGAASPTRSSRPTKMPWPWATGPASTACRAGRGSAGPCSTTPSRGAAPAASSRFAAPRSVC